MIRAFSRSRYLSAGAPKTCANPACQKVLADAAWRCENLYFCDEHCAYETANSGLRRIERLAGSVS